MPTLAFKMQAQLHSDWCWAAVAASVSQHFNADSSWCQCKLASIMARITAKKEKLGAQACCSRPMNKRLAAVCNQAWYLDRALRIVGRSAGRPTKGPLTFRRIQKEILAGRPVCVRIQWGRATSGHFVLISGCRESTRGGQWLYVEDSFYGNSTWRYHEFRSNYQYAGGRWTNTYPVENEAPRGRKRKRAAA
ncbi:MAG TPA: papain-like cysteine protease family protein [Bryobacteraceae bacterium]|nr:papain-like cysteine protease family protein [Bryobacteraceae bacterium]